LIRDCGNGRKTPQEQERDANRKLYKGPISSVESWRSFVIGSVTGV